MLIICSFETDTRDNASVLGTNRGKTLPLSFIVHWFEKYSLNVSFLFEIRDENSILNNGWNIRSPFFINNFFISIPKKFLSCFRVGKFITQVRIICKLSFFDKFIAGLTHITYIIVIMWVLPIFFRSHPWGVFIIASDNFIQNVLAHYVQKCVSKY